VNLLAHSDCFARRCDEAVRTTDAHAVRIPDEAVWCGTPKDVYLKVSPFFFANKLTLPLLIMTAEDDAIGTTPLQATKLFEAIRETVATGASSWLPDEPHWYAALESKRAYVAEMLHWLDRYVKNAPR